MQVTERRVPKFQGLSSTGTTHVVGSGRGGLGSALLPLSRRNNPLLQRGGGIGQAQQQQQQQQRRPIRMISCLAVLSLVIVFQRTVTTIFPNGIFGKKSTKSPHYSIDKAAIPMIPENDHAVTCLSKAPLLGSQVFPPYSKVGDPESSSCSYTIDDSLLHNTQNTNNSTILELQQKVKNALVEWTYEKKVKSWKGKLQGLRVLDVGMGQGPWGAALMEYTGIDYYVGLDPGVCPPVHANTRDPRFAKKGTMAQCKKLHKTTNAMDPRVVNCTGHGQKYRAFDVTGLEMMAAYNQNIALLPGTFETVNQQLKQIVFDVVMLNMVTEHLSDLHGVFKGLWELLNSCSQQATIFIRHHNYYGFTGHHGSPQSAKEAEALEQEQNPDLLELADWGHLEPDASQGNVASINRVRPGDLQTLLDVYFVCDCETGKTSEKERSRMTNERRSQLVQRGFDVDTELFMEKVNFRCTRRPQPKFPFVLDRLVLFHPPMDGSYKAQPFKCDD